MRVPRFYPWTNEWPDLINLTDNFVLAWKLMSQEENAPTTPTRQGVVAVISRGSELLAIRRSMSVAAPGKICFPGGGIEPGETEEEALVRELREELDLAIRPVRRLWASETPWRVALAWWEAEVLDSKDCRPNPMEVSEVLWLSPSDLMAHSDLLESNQRFLELLHFGRIKLNHVRPLSGA